MKMVEEFNLVRVIYGKKDMPLNKREYRVREFDSSAVGSMEEIKDFLKDKGYSKFRFVLHDHISEDPPIHSIDYDLTKKKPIPIKMKGKKGWRSESARHSLSRKGIKTGRKKKSRMVVMPSYKKVAVEGVEPISGKKSDIEMFVPEGDVARGIPDKEKERIMKKYQNKKNWKYPTKPALVKTEAEAKKIADVLTYYLGGAEITPTNGKFKVMSKGYYHYIGA